MMRLLYYLKNTISRRNLLFIFISIILLSVSSFTLLQLYTDKNQQKIKKKDNTLEIKKLTDIGDALYFDNKMDSSYFYFKKVKNLCDPKTNTIDYVYALTCISEYHMLLGNYIDSEASATETLPYLKLIKNPRYSWIVYNQLGINYTNTYNYNNAILYFKKAISLKSSMWRKYIALNNLAAVYMNQERYEDAIRILLPLSKQKRTFKQESSDYENYAFVIDNLGFCYYRLGNSKLALHYLEEALNIKIKIKTPEVLIGSYKHFAVFYEKTNAKLAKEYAKKAHIEALKTTNVTILTRTLALLIKNSEKNELKKYSINYIKITDSIDTAIQKARNQFSNIKYTSEEDKTENLQLKAQQAENELQLERQKSRNIISYIIILFTTISGLFIYFHLTSKRKKEKNNAIFESEMRISKKLSDELTNDVYQILALTENIDLVKEENKEKLLNNLNTIYSKIRNVSRENSSIVTDKNYSIALKEMISVFKTPEINILVNGFDAIPWNEIEKNKKIILYRILQELFSNMKKHSNATLVSITFKITHKNLTIFYSDNDLNIKNNVAILKNGLQNVESRIKTINGNIIFDYNSEKGFRLNFSFPI